MAASTKEIHEKKLTLNCGARDGSTSAPSALPKRIQVRPYTKIPQMKKKPDLDMNKKKIIKIITWFGCIFLDF